MFYNVKPYLDMSPYTFYLIVGTLGFMYASPHLLNGRKAMAADIRPLFTRQSKALQAENERLRSDEALSAWKTSMLRHLKVYTSGGSTGLMLCSMILMGIS
ncbi:hypothetical protein [Paenibacillus sp. BJ-4]|uniref:hypothetical protein n=1 Tax=Paenibacillus sp. BJ-4 TaxID=2878097 RepID=UPI001CEFC122|nr:hypothetical protein [Paenibacillus sp. BJ-4]